MRYFVPTRIHAKTDLGIGVGDPYYLCTNKSPNVPTEFTYPYVAPGEALEEVDDPNFFWCTHDREFNDCVHSKLISYDGSRLDVPVASSNRRYYSIMTCPNGPWSEHVTNSSWKWGMGTKFYCGSSTSKHYIYGAQISKMYNTGTDFRLTLYVIFLDNRNYRVYQYGNSGYLNVQFRTAKREVIYRKTKTVTVTDVIVRENPYNLDISILTSAISRLIENVVWVWVSSWGDYARVKDCRIWEQILDTAIPYCQTISNAMLKAGFGGLPYSAYKPMLVSPVKLPDPLQNFRLHEKEIIADRTDPYLVTAGQDWSQYWWNVLIQQAYLDALNSVPRLNDNSISNILEIAGFIRSLVIERKVEIPKSLSDAWLSYRYQYTTGKLDAKEAIEFIHRHRSLGTLDKWISCYGISSVTYDDVDITCRCGLDIRPSEVALLQKIWRALYTYGLTPSFYVIWDMIPYSFIVDWFLPIGRMAAVLDAEQNYSETYYEIKNVTFSFSYDVAVDGMFGCEFHQYTRYLSPGVVTLNGFYFFEEDPVSSRVIGYRALDAFSLILGRR